MRSETHNETFLSLSVFSRNKITPVILIDYNASSFDPIALLDDLKRAKSVDIKECVWQLGEGPLAEKHAKKYADDLKTLKILCESVSREWNVAAIGSTSIDPEKVTFDVEGFDFGR
jgi:hypothetical protein